MIERKHLRTVESIPNEEKKRLETNWYHAPRDLVVRLSEQGQTSYDIAVIDGGPFRRVTVYEVDPVTNVMHREFINIMEVIDRDRVYYHPSSLTADLYTGTQRLSLTYTDVGEFNKNVAHLYQVNELFLDNNGRSGNLELSDEQIADLKLEANGYPTKINMHETAKRYTDKRFGTSPLTPFSITERPLIPYKNPLIELARPLVHVGRIFQRK